jgi:sugar-specific transcriptional regulator TrmB
LSEATVSELAHKVEMPRTTVQEVLDHMQKKGLVSSYTKHTHKYWVAENPEKLIISLQEREEALKSILPELKALRPEMGNRPQVKVFQGVKEIKLILDDIIETKHHILALISWDDWVHFFGDEYIHDFIERRYKHFLKIRVVSPKTELSEKLKTTDSEQLRQTRFLPSNDFYFCK